MALVDEAPLVHATMRLAFADSRRFAQPSSALGESLAEVGAAMARGGAVVATDADHVVGCARFARDAEGVHISRLGVLLEHRARGHGAAMVAFIEELALGVRVFAAARAQQPDNRSWWQRRGYVVVGYDDYYGIRDFRVRLVKAV